MKTQPEFNNLDYMTDPTFGNMDWLFVLSSKACENGPAKNGPGRYYMPLIEIEDFNGLIDNRPIFEWSIKIEASEKLVEMQRNNDDTTGKLSDYLYH